MPHSLEALEAAFNVADERTVPQTRNRRAQVPFSDDDMVARALSASGGERFQRLWSGDNSGYDEDDSRGDLAFCSIAAFWTGADPRRVDAWFRRSGRMRTKWDERHAADGRTYGQMTIDKALSGKVEVYEAALLTSTPRGDGDGAVGVVPERFTDVGNARFMASLFGEDIRYTAGLGYLVWDGTRWRRDSKEVMVERLAQKTINEMLQEAAILPPTEGRSAIIKHALKSEDVRRVRAMVQLVRSQSGILVETDDFDRDAWLLNCCNGTLELRTGALREHRRDDLITKLAPVEYDEEARCPLWLAFLERIFAGNRQMIDFVQRAVGYALTGDVSERVLFIFYGKGRNGKTTLLGTMMTILGDYARQAAPRVLMVTRNEQHPTDLADLAGARFVAAIEVEENKRLSEVTVKQMTGNDRMKARFMRQDFFEFPPTHKIFLATNHKPVIRGTDDAIWDRLRLTPFLVRIPEDEDDTHLREKLLDESSGILAWAIQGTLAWLKDGLGTPIDVKEATSSYREEMDVLGHWIADCCTVSPAAIETSTNLYGNYAAWCKSSGERTSLTKAMFGMALEERGFAKGRGTKGVRTRRGICLRAPSSDSVGDAGDAR